MPGYLLGLLVGGGLAFLVGAILLAIARAVDRKNYIIQKATPMPLALVNERDDVWLRAEVECDAPVDPPHFSISCLYYSYKLEEHVRRVRQTKKGTEFYYEWVTREQSSDAATFRLREGKLTIEIDGGEAEFKDTSYTSDREGDFRHSLTYAPYPATMSAVGSVSEGRKRLEKYESIPLMVTPLAREDYVRAAERGEKILRFIGFVLVWLGAALAFYGLFDHVSWPVETGMRFAPGTLVAALLAGTAVFVPVWAFYIYNTLVAYSVRLENAWRQIDVDLKMRYDLIPNLVAAVKGSMKHEKDLLERLVAVRAEATAGGRGERIAMEGRVAGSMLDVTAAIEKYPKLKSRRAVKKLMRELKAIEEKIAHGRTTYNDAVREYNENVLSFPRALLARISGFKTHDFFGTTGAERETPKA